MSDLTGTQTEVFAITVRVLRSENDVRMGIQRDARATLAAEYPDFRITELVRSDAEFIVFHLVREGWDALGRWKA